MAWISATTLVMLSDRAPGLLKRLATRVDAGGSRAAKAVSETPIPESDFEIHVLAWLVAALLVGMATWSWRSLALAGVSLFAFSMAVEGGQHLLTATRSAQLGDLTANAIGVALGIGVAAIIAAGLRLEVRR